MRPFFRRLLWTLGVLAVLVVLLYAEEDWRGARAWNQVRTEYIRSGGDLDYRHLVSSVPDDENLATLPLFARQPDSQGFPYWATLEKALHKKEKLPEFPKIGNWERGERPDFEKLHAGTRAMYTAVFKNGQVPAAPLAQWTALYPFVDQLRDAARQRPNFVFNLPYDPTHPFDHSFGPIAHEITLAKVIAVHALLALETGQSSVALDDTRLLQSIAARAGGSTSVIAGLVSIGVSAINTTVIREGLARHSWNDAQLAKLQGRIAELDYLALGQTCIRGEVDYCLDAVTQTGLLFTRRFYVGPAFWDNDIKLLCFWTPWPQGWIDLNKAKILTLQRKNLSILDPAAHRAAPERGRQLKTERGQEKLFGNFVLPTSYFVFLSMGPQEDFSSQIALAQVCRDELRVACGLERYRLAHGSYPASLAELEPNFCAHLPNDLVTGQPLHYQLKPDGTYLLYSVGWNEKDDGGTLVYGNKRYDGTPTIDTDQGDWVWFGTK